MGEKYEGCTHAFKSEVSRYAILQVAYFVFLHFFPRSVLSEILNSLVLISLRGLVGPKAAECGRTDGWMIEPITSLLMERCVNELRH
jgi:hypothetical protein